ASPLLGTPQGISIFIDGVRQNQPFGDSVGWDLIPRAAISEMALVPGSNPLFGLNTLGGALSLRTKSGLSHDSTALTLRGGSFGRKMADIEQGGSTPQLAWFLGSSLFFEDGWRESSPTNVRQFFGKLEPLKAAFRPSISFGFANNALIGNGLGEQRFLQRDYRSIYTRPDVTWHRAPYANVNLARPLGASMTLSGNAYFRYIGTRTLNGDLNEDSLNQSVYQPNAAERAALTAAGYRGFPLAGENAANTPFPRWRCIANVLLRDEPAEKCNGLINRSVAAQRNYGAAGQWNWFRGLSQVTAGAAYDASGVGFTQSTELGYLNPDRSITGLGAFGDGVSGGEADGEPFDTRVNLTGRIRSLGVFATASKPWGRLSLTLSGRFNRTSVDNRDRIRPLPGTGSLTGFHVFNRFNPAIGATWKASAAVQLYASLNQGNRAPTAIELGCADPEAPCRLPNAMQGDPPLQQVRTLTVEAGIRRLSEGSWRWSAGVFQAANRDDILFVASEQTGYGYFKNFDKTRRRGLEAELTRRLRRGLVGGGYTLLDATFRSTEEVNGAGNSSNEDALDGIPGTEGAIRISPGNRIPLIARHLTKAFGEFDLLPNLKLDAGVNGVSSSLARGNENGLHRPDGRYYLGEGKSPGYAVVNLGARLTVHRRTEIFVQVNNLFDRRYYSAAQLGPTGFTAAGNFIARPFPAIRGEFPVQNVTFYAPGAPRGVWGGVRFRFQTSRN
ncbi:MAG: TonB-dependent receptor, partial [Acidobacteria bacterium]|nr:TonB-dependent receptor [Acidobacteriota bacterium]